MDHNPVTIEFFHDVICSFCFPMSYRMREIQKLFPDVQIVHRSFALVRSERDFDRMFGSRGAAKSEILGHWRHANHNDDLHRFNIAGMQEADFLFPTSMNVLTACKAAYFTAGENGYWDVFDALQNALFVQSRNIEDESVIQDCVRQSGIDFEQWSDHFKNADTRQAVEKDLALATQYGIHGVPCLVINGQHQVSGAQSIDRVIQAIQDAQAVAPKTSADGPACQFANGKFQCD